METLDVLMVVFSGIVAVSTVAYLLITLKMFRQMRGANRFEGVKYFFGIAQMLEQWLGTIKAQNPEHSRACDQVLEEFLNFGVKSMLEWMKDGKPVSQMAQHIT